MRNLREFVREMIPEIMLSIPDQETMTAEETANYLRKNSTSSPRYFERKIRESGKTFFRKRLNVDDVLSSDPDATEYVEYSLAKRTERYPRKQNDWKLELPIIIFDGEVFDGYNRLLKAKLMGKDFIDAYVG